MRSLFARLAIVGALGIALSGCGGSSGTALPNGAAPNGIGGGAINATASQFRFIDGSPDAGNIDIYFDGAKVATNVPYKFITAYITVSSAAHTVAAFATGSTTTVVIPTTTIAPAGPRTTVLIVAQAGNANKGVLAFGESTAVPAAGQGAVIFHHAAPSVALPASAALAFGSTTATPLAPPAGPALIPTTAYKAVNRVSPLPANASNPATGIAFYVALATTPTVPLATFLPSAALGGAADTTNTFPYSNAPNQPNLAVYAIDAAGVGNVTLVGVFDDNSF